MSDAQHPLSNHILIKYLWEMLTCALKAQDKEPNIVTFC